MVYLCPLWLMSQATYCFWLGIKRSVSQLVLYSSLGSGLPEYEYRKQLTPQTVIYTSVYNPSREERFLSIPTYSELSRFNGWNSAKRFFNMSAVLTERRNKDKNYLAKTIIVSRNFCKSTQIFK